VPSRPSVFGAPDRYIDHRRRDRVRGNSDDIRARTACTEWFVDGGTRSIVPIGAALKNGMTNVWAVLTYNNALSRRFVFSMTGNVLSSFENANWIEIAARAGEDILPAAIAEDDIDPPAGWGSAAVTIVEPEAGSDIHNGFSIDPGLIRIRMMHGYMRADDVNNARWLAQVTGGRYLDLVDKVSDALRTTEIVQTRYEFGKRSTTGLACS